MYKLLLIASACDGEDVGEAWSGFQWVVRLAARHDVTLLTMCRRDRTPPSVQLPGVRVVEWKDPRLFARYERFNSMLKPGYVPFYVGARRWIRAALARGEQFDLIHQLLPLGMRYPTPAVGMGVPYLIGPVGGSLPNPEGFSDDTAPWFVRLRALDRIRMRWDPMMRRSYEQAACVIGIAPYVLDTMRGLQLRRFEVMSDTGLVELPVPGPAREPDGVVRLIFVGRLVRTKGLRDAIRALSLVRTDRPFRLDVLGEGPDRAACEALVAQTGLGDRVTFHGWQPRERVREFYDASDVFVFPSYREPGGNVVLEAMGYGLPLIVSDRGGPASSADDSCAFRVHVGDPDQYASDLAAAITRLIEEPDLRAEMGRAARRRVAERFVWDRKVEQLEALYGELVPAPAGSPALTSAGFGDA